MAQDRSPQATLVLEFIGAMLQRTMACPTAEAHQQALQGWLNELAPWINSVDLPTLVGQPCTLLSHLAFTPNGDGEDEDIAVALSPQGEAVFRAWLRQRGLDPLLSRS